MKQGPQGKGLGATPGGGGVRLTSPAHFTKIMGFSADSLYILNQAVGATLPDLAGAETLTKGAGGVVQRTVGGAFGHEFTEFTATSGYTKVNANHPNLDSVIVGAVFNVAMSGGAANPGIIGYGSLPSGYPSFMLYRAGSTVNYCSLYVGDSVSAVLLSDVTVNIVNPRGPVLVLGQIDRATSKARFLVSRPYKLLTTKEASVAAIGNINGGASSSFGIGGCRWVHGGNGVEYGFFLRGTKCEGSTKLNYIADRLGFVGTV